MTARQRRSIPRNESIGKSFSSRGGKKRPASFYIIIFFLFVLIFSGIFETVRHIRFSKAALARFKR